MITLLVFVVWAAILANVLATRTYLSNAEESLRVARLRLAWAEKTLAEARQMLQACRDYTDPEHPLPWEMEWRE